MLINAIANQKVFPGAGDVDDCWVVSTWMCANAVRPDIPKGTITWMRGAAGDPDDGVNDGGNTTEILRMCRRMWPDIRVVDLDGKSWEWLIGRLKATVRPASIAVHSGSLPLVYRFGFGGGHQIVIWWENGALWMANPLAAEGAAPKKVDPIAIRKAAYTLGNGSLRGVLFPTYAEAQSTWTRYTQDQLNAAIAAATAQYKDQITKDAAEDAAVKAAIEGQLQLLVD